MNDCTNCNHKCYDPTFGETRCRVYNHKIRDLDKYIDCVQHSKKETSNER